MSHTKGPWRLGPEKCSYKINDRKKELICEENGFPTSFFALGIGNEDENKTIAIVPLDDSNEENARLIAAAPDLLKACKEALDCLRRPQRGISVTRVTLQMAIDKAEG